MNFNGLANENFFCGRSWFEKDNGLNDTATLRLQVIFLGVNGVTLEGWRFLPPQNFLPRLSFALTPRPRMRLMRVSHGIVGHIFC